ncbi:MAG: ABC transporter substrate-binding protein [Betaproteobacteria bacterium]|nr:ABC transporter substrate-binding protein [Betaproteobacteria bacterium]
MNRRRFLAGTAGTVAIESWRGSVIAAERLASNRIRIVTGLRATVQSLGWIGTEIGIFKRLGLEVAFPKLETGGPEAASGLVRGDWEFAETGSSQLIQGVLDGRDTVILLTPTAPSPTGPLLLARQGIGEPAQLDGKRIGVLTETGQIAIGVRVALRAWGVDATLIPLGTFGKIYAAVGAGEVDAGALPPDYRFLGPREFKLNVIQAPSAGFSSAAVGCTRHFIAANRALVALLVQGYVETIHFFKTQRAAVIPLLQRFLMFKDPGAVEEAYDFYAPLFQPSPRPPAEGIRKLLDELAIKQPAAVKLSVDSVADLSFLDELERNGLMRKLYGR